MARGVYTNNVYGTQVASTKDSLATLIARLLVGTILNFVFWLMLGWGLWNSALVPLTGVSPLSLPAAASVLAGLFLGRVVFCLKS
jgi:hypothetical protein